MRAGTLGTLSRSVREHIHASWIVRADTTERRAFDTDRAASDTLETA